MNTRIFCEFFRILIIKLSENSHLGSFHLLYFYYFQMKNILKHEDVLIILENINILKPLRPKVP